VVAGLTLQQILQQGYAAFERCHPLPAYVRKAAWALLVCRTAVLGGHIQTCPEGHVERVWYNSCRHRLCPPCAWLQVERWLMTQKARLLACEPYHVIFTLPSELHALWRANVPVMTTLLFASVRDTLLELLGDEKYLGATPGIIATLHPWSQTLRLHPHLHSLVTGGGLTRTGQWVAVHNGFLLPSRVVMALFRGKLLAALRRALRQGQLQLPVGMHPQRCENLLNKLGRAKWNVHLRERYPHGAGVLTYLARYLRGGPLANRRLVSCAHGEVTFRYRVNGEAAESPRSGLMTLPIEEFIGRYLRHVPPPGSRVVRAYGLYAPTKGDTVAVCRAQLGQGPVATPVVLDWQMVCRQYGGEPPEQCPVCGRLLVCSGVIPRSSGPAAVDVCGERVA
jgi:putative transposase/transposase-like zinc-binding protein